MSMIDNHHSIFHDMSNINIVPKYIPKYAHQLHIVPKLIVDACRHVRPQGSAPAWRRCLGTPPELVAPRAMVDSSMIDIS